MICNVRKLTFVQSHQNLHWAYFWSPEDGNFPHADNADSDQIVRMHRRIRPLCGFEYMFVICNGIRIKGEVSGAHNCFKPLVFFSSDRPKAAHLLRLFFVWQSVVYMWSLFCHYLFLISPSFGASWGLNFVIKAFAFSGYLHLQFCWSHMLEGTLILYAARMIKYLWWS